MEVELSRDRVVDLAQELPELDGPVTGLALRDERPELVVEGREEGGGAVPDVVVRAPLDLAGTHRQERLRSIQRLDLALLVDAEDKLLARGGLRYRPTTSRTFSMKRGSVEELERLGTVGLERERPPDRLIALWLIPTCFAIERVLQCVASSDFVSSVRVITRSMSGSEIVRGAPGRGSSSRPYSRCERKR